MWKVHNTTDIPDLSVYAAGAFAMEDTRLQDWVRSVTIRNKSVGILHGQFGCYRGWSRDITVNVPLIIPADWRLKLQYCGWRIVIRSKQEFLVAILAHEFRHAYYHMTNNMLSTHYAKDRSVRRAAEIKCEMYEERKLVEFQRLLDNDNRQMKAAHNG